MREAVWSVVVDPGQPAPLQDRRQVHCRITAEGLDVLKLLDGPVSAAEEAVMKPIGRAGQQQLIDLLDQLRAGSAVSHK